MFILAKKGGGTLKKVNAKFSKGVDFWKLDVLTEAGVKAKKRQKIVKILHRMGIGAQKLTYFNPRQRVESASKRQKRGDFRARITLQDELFFVVILNTIFMMTPMCYPPARTLKSDKRGFS